jgi:Cu(I)/Ag(I) efflux system membrane protein CusA/SilA
MRDVARVELVPDERRGIAELNGEGEVVGGIAMARYGENALDVIDNAQGKIAEIAADCPDGRDDPHGLRPLRADPSRHRNAAKWTLIEESLIVALVCAVFLLHVRSALVAIVMLPVGVLIAFIAMRALGMNSNIMSLGGIAIAIGAMVDAAIVMIENAHKHIERATAAAAALQLIIDACRRWGRRCSSAC